MDRILAKSPPAISVIIKIELCCWKTTSAGDLQVLHRFIADAWIFELKEAIKLKTAELRKAYKIKLPDATIAATALIHDLTLITSNSSDFDSIEGLKFVNPFDL